jgi:phosphonate transport system substrate-binding protein
MKTLGLKHGLSIISLVMVVMVFLAGCSTTTTSEKGLTGVQETKAKASKEKSELDVLKIGLIPAEDNEEMIKKFQPVIEYLSQELDMEVEPFVATDYTAVVEAMRSKHIDVGFFGPFSYILASEHAGAEAFAVGVREDGQSTYNSGIFIHSESGIKSLLDLKGKNVAFVDPASTSGNLFPRALLKRNGIDPDKDFATVTYAGGHDAAILAVKNKKVDAVGSNDITFNRMIEEGLISDGEVVNLAWSDPIPGSPVAYQKELDSEIKDKLKKAFMDMHEKAPEALSGYGKIIQYESTVDTDYDVIRETAQLLDLDPAKLK